MSDLKKRDALKKIVRSMLISSKRGLSLEQFCSDYRNQEGREFPYVEFGCCSASQLLLEFSDVVKSSNFCGNHWLQGIADGDTRHIEKLVLEQKSDVNQRNRTSKSKVATKTFVRARQSVSAEKSHFNNKPVKPPEPLMKNVRKREPFVPNDIKRRMKDLIECHPEGIKVTSFFKVWNRLFSTKVAFTEYGYTELEQFFRAMPDIVKVIYIKGELWLDPVDKINVNSPAKKSTNVVKSESIREFTPDDMCHSFGNSDMLTENRDCNIISDAEEDVGTISKKMQQEFKEILLKSPNGVFASRFCEEYKEYTKKKLQVVELGYFSVVDMVDAHQHIFTIHRSDKFSDDFLLYSKDLKPNSELPDTSAVNMNLNRKEVKGKFKKLLSCNPHGILLNNFPKVYQEVYGEPLTELLQGYDDLESFVMENIPGVVQFNITGKNNVTMTLRENGLDDPLLLVNTVPVQPLCLPSDAVGFGTKYTIQALPSVSEMSDTYIEIQVSTVSSPSKFWFFLNKTVSDLNNVMDALEEFYDKEESKIYAIPGSCVAIGLPCAAVYPEDNNWHRCTITKLKDDECVEVNYVDYGTTGYVNKNILRYLRKQFFVLPAQAIIARLSHIKPANMFQEARWTKKAAECFLNMVKQRIVLAKVMNVVNFVTMVILYDTNQEIDIVINDELVNKGFASFTTQAPPTSNLTIPPSIPNMDPNFLINYMLASNFSAGVNNPLNTALAMQLLSQPQPAPVNPLNLLAAATDQVNQLSLVASLAQLQSANTTVTTVAPSITTVASTSTVPSTLPTAITSCDSRLPDVASTLSNVDSSRIKSSYSTGAVQTDRNSYDVNSNLPNKRYVKRLSLGDGLTIHIINHNDMLYMTSSEISLLCGNEKDNLRRQLRSINFKVPSSVLVDNETFPLLFFLMSSFDIKGVKDPDVDTVKEFVLLYPLNIIPKILRALVDKPSAVLLSKLKKECEEFDPFSPYWSGKNTDQDSGINVEASPTTTVSVETLKRILDGLKAERKELIEEMMKDDSFCGGAKLKDVEDQIESIKTKMESMKFKKFASLSPGEKTEESIPGRLSRTADRSTPDGASDVPNAKSQKPTIHLGEKYDVNAPPFRPVVVTQPPTTLLNPAIQFHRFPSTCNFGHFLPTSPAPPPQFILNPPLMYNPPTNYNPPIHTQTFVRPQQWSTQE